MVIGSVTRNSKLGTTKEFYSFPIPWSCITRSMHPHRATLAKFLTLKYKIKPRDVSGQLSELELQGNMP